MITRVISTRLLLGGLTVAGLTLSACSMHNSGPNAKRYNSIYDQCMPPACAYNPYMQYGSYIPPTMSSYYMAGMGTGMTSAQPGHPQYMGGGYSATCPEGTTMRADGMCEGTVSTTSTSTGSYSSMSTSGSLMSDCPAGSVMNSDGTCLMVSSSTPSSVGQSYSYSSVSNTSGRMTQCPSGTTMSSDGSCLSVSSSSSSMVQNYNYPSTSTVTACPSGTTMTADGTCMTVSSSSYPAPSYTQPSFNPIRK